MNDRPRPHYTPKPLPKSRVVIQFIVSASEKRRYQAKARKAGVSLSQFIRSRLKNAESGEALERLIQSQDDPKYLVRYRERLLESMRRSAAAARTA